MTLSDFVEQIEREQPDVLTAADVSAVAPQPWILRAGSGKEARIRMLVGKLRYEREPGDNTWYLSRAIGDLDVLDAA